MFRLLGHRSKGTLKRAHFGHNQALQKGVEVQRRFCGSAKKKTIWEDLSERALINDSTVPVNTFPTTGSIYVGFDPTADSLHIGNLLGITVLNRFKNYGWKPIALVGGATGLIGDPSGRKTERSLLSEETLQSNLNGITKIFDNLFHGQIEVVNNYDWYKNMTALEFLRDIGKLFRVNPMLAKEAIKSRVENEQQGVSFTEFSYQILQSHDFYHLFVNNNCTIQFGGSDQWGNITAGIDYIRKKTNSQAYGFTLPLLTDSEGNKIGKSTSTGATIWLSPEKTSAYDFYQYWLNRPDSDLQKLLYSFSFKEKPQIDEILNEHAKNPDLRTGQTELAAELTQYIHGQKALTKAALLTKIFFNENFEILKVPEEQLLETFEGLPRLTHKNPSQIFGKSISEILAGTNAGKTKTAARKLIERDGGVYLNNTQIKADRPFTPNDMIHKNLIILRIGKKDYHVIKLVQA